MFKYLHFYVSILLFLSVCLVSGCGLGSSNSIDASIPSAPLVVLSGLEIQPKDRNMQIVLKGSQPFAFDFDNHDNPLRLTIDIAQAQIAQPEAIQVDRGGIQSVQLQSLPGSEQTARLEVHLEERAFYRLKKDGDRLIVGVQLAEPSGIEAMDRKITATTVAPLDEGPTSTPQAALPAPEKTKEKAEQPPVLLPEIQEYRVGPGDELAIDIYGEPELSKPYVVSERGTLAFQFVGAIPVSGQTTSEIAEALKAALSPKYVLDPQISVEIKKYKSQRVFVVGGISPATFTLRDDTTLIEILSQLKGLESNSHVLVYRRGYGEASDTEQGYNANAIRVDLERLLRQGDMSLNFVLQPRDVIYVPSVVREGVQQVFVVGVVRPRTFPLAEGMTLLEILSQLEDLETRTHVLVYRRAYADNSDGALDQEGKPIRVDLERLLRQGDMRLNLALEPRDVIYIPAAEKGVSATKSINVFGEVNKPGPIELPETGMTIIDAIAEAGGFSQWAAPRRTRVLRMQDGKERTIKVNVSAVMRGKLSQNIELKPNDVVVVPERSLF